MSLVMKLAEHVIMEEMQLLIIALHVISMELLGLILSGLQIVSKNVDIDII
jgi:hypothetical protein